MRRLLGFLNHERRSVKRFLESFLGSFFGIVLALTVVRLMESPPDALVLMSEDGSTEFEITALPGTVWATTRNDGKSFIRVLWDDRTGSSLPGLGGDVASM